MNTNSHLSTSFRHEGRKVNGAKLALPVVLALTFFGAVDAYAANRYVRAGGSGTQDGSDWSNAYPALPSTLVRGDTYYIADGGYSGRRTFNTPASSTTPITIKKATAADHGTNTGWSADLGDGQATFSGGFTFTTPYWVFDGQTGGGAANNWTGNFGFKVTETGDTTALFKMESGGSNVTIRHVDMQGKGSVSANGGSLSNDGLAVIGASNVTLSYFRMAGIGRCPVFASPKNMLIEHGWVQSYYGSSTVHSEIASIWGFAGSVGDVTFRHNLFTDIKSTGGIMWDNQTNTSARLNIYGNVFYKPPGAYWEKANGLIGGWTARQFRNATVNNNTFINVDQQSLSTFPQTYSGNVAYNNIFYNSQSPDFSLYERHDYNHFVNSGGSHSEPNGTSVTSADLFVNVAGYNFRLKTAAGRGMTVQTPFNLDPLNVVRGADGTTDRGAYEFGGTTGIISAPTNLQVQ